MTAYNDGYVVVTDGLRLHYRDYAVAAKGPPLVCLHGLTRNARDFAAFAELHSARFRVIALDFRGRGISDYDPVPTRYVPFTYALDVQQLLDQLGLAAAIFVGTSLGGLVTMALAAMAPQRVIAAILNDVGPELGEAGLDRIQKYVGKGERFVDWDEAADAVARQQRAAFPTYQRGNWLDMARRNCCERDGAIMFDYDPAIAHTFKAARDAPKVDLWPLFAALAQKPLLIVRGAISELLSAATAEKMRALAPHARFVEVPRIGHAPMLDEPEAAAAIDAFLASVARDPQSAP